MVFIAKKFEKRQETMRIEIDFKKIVDWNSFHEIFKKIMGFPDFYGKNNNAWIDCMSYIDDKEAGMSEITITPGRNLEIVILGTECGAKNCPKVFLGFMELVADVNQRFIESDTQTRLIVIAT